MNKDKNPDGVFEIRHAVPAEIVVLVDDIVDSGWTLTLAVALMWQAGCKTIFPVALASSKQGA